EEEVAKFNKQLADGSKLQKDFKAYLAAVKTMHECSKRLLDCLAEMYDPEWFGKEEVDSIAEDTDLLWQDFHQNLVDNNLISMDTYLAQFPDIKARIAKRERKLVDFDSARHHFTSIQKSKKKDEAKIAKPLALVEMAAPGWAQGIITAHQIAQTNLSRSQAEEDLGRAQKVFEEINYDLQEELPTLWNSRVGLYVNTFQSVAGLEEKFHRDMGKPGQSPAADPSQQWDTDEEAAAQSYSQQPFEAPRWDEQESVSAQSGWGNETATPAQPDWEGDGVEHWGEEGSQVGQKQDADTNWGRGTAQAWEAESERPQWEELQIVRGTRLIVVVLWSNVIELGWFRSRSCCSVVWMLSIVVMLNVPFVKAIHDYGATDSDELDLKAGDIVLVLAFANPDEQDDGWLMGVKESHWLQNKNLLAKGVFPENFTQKL
uniref:Myc box-dependent-interacting protein 1-like n=1 Tax=Sinocyclocheilus rhinocerous TaxID=307959 RepID=A0A673K5L6_9TELE